MSEITAISRINPTPGANARKWSRLSFFISSKNGRN